MPSGTPNRESPSALMVETGKAPKRKGGEATPQSSPPLPSGIHSRLINHIYVVSPRLGTRAKRHNCRHDRSTKPPPSADVATTTVFPSLPLNEVAGFLKLPCGNTCSAGADPLISVCFI